MNPAKLPEFPPTLAHMVNDQRCYADELDLAELIRDYARAAVEASQPSAAVAMPQERPKSLERIISERGYAEIYAALSQGGKP